MPKTVLIIGTSSGIGRETAKYFANEGWNIIDTMRSPEKETEFINLANVLVSKLDVTNIESIKESISKGIEKFGSIDVLINNAGYGLSGPFEPSTDEQIKQQFEVNVFAVEGFSDSLQYELSLFGIRIKLIEPGTISTDFYNRSMVKTDRKGFTAYENYVNKVLTKLNNSSRRGVTPNKVAKIIYKAATDNSNKLRYPAAGNAGLILTFRKILSDSMFNKLVRSQTE